jgi:uncharacterized membrane protein
MTDDDYVQENEGVRVFGMGVGTFVLFLLFMSLITAWTLSIPCQRVPMLVTRWCSLLIVGIVSLLLVFADRETRFNNVDYSESTYEESLPSRLAVCIFMIISTLASIVLIVFGPSSDTFLTTSHEVEANTLWVD